MSLFTVIVYFGDGTYALEQYKAYTPREALVTFVNQSKALSIYNRTHVLGLIGKGEEVLHLTQDRYGVWAWGASCIPHEMNVIQGACIIQTDPRSLHAASSTLGDPGLSSSGSDARYYRKMNPVPEQELLDALKAAEQLGDPEYLESSLRRLVPYLAAQGRFAEAAPYWRRQALWVEKLYGPNSRELGSFLHNMAGMCLMPAGFVEDARSVLLRAKEIYARYVQPEDDRIRQVEQLLHQLPT